MQNTKKLKTSSKFPPLDVARFDVTQEPRRVSWYLRPITWLISFPSVWRHRVKIDRVKMEGLKAPYLMLCNHNAFFDFMVATAAVFPHQPYYIVAVDGFVGKSWLMRRVGCIPKRKFTNDVRLVRQLQRVSDRGKIVAFYPEARYSLCGTNAVLPPSLGKLSKLLKIPVVTLITNGHHINSPFWNLKSRKIKTHAKMEQIITQGEINDLTYEEINKRINDAFVYDDFAWQKQNKIRVKYKNRAKGLHKVLYQCPHCKAEYNMDSDGIRLWCKKCNHTWEMSEYGELTSVEGETYFSHIPDWYEWERKNVVKEIEDDKYYFESECRVHSLPNAKGFVDIGEGHLVHNMEGFVLSGGYRGQEYTLKIPTQALYSCHIEYNYLKWKRDCIDLSTLTDTFFIFPKGDDFSVTKISLATEELFIRSSGSNTANNRQSLQIE